MVATWVKDINTDPGCNRIVDSDMVSGSSPGLVVIMAPGSGEGHPDWHGSSSSMAQGSPTWPQVVAQATGIGMALYGNRSHVYQQTLAAVGPIHGPWQQPSPDITVALGGKQTSPSVYSSWPSPQPQVASRHLTSAYRSLFSFLSPSTVCEPFCFPFSPISPPLICLS